MRNATKNYHSLLAKQKKLVSMLFTMKIPRRVLLTWIIAAFLLLEESACFVLTAKPWHFHGRGYQHLCSSSSSENNNGGEFMDEMRRMLEASWDAKTMGDVPRDSTSAAEAAVVSLQRAIRDDSGGATTSAYLIDLQFPPYDIAQGENMYDEVASVEFCMELARGIFKSRGSNSLILVKDDKTVQTVNRVLRERERSSTALVVDEEDDGDNEETIGARNSNVSHSSSPEDISSDDVNSFRQKLMSTWDDSSTPAAAPFAETAKTSSEKRKAKSELKGQQTAATGDNSRDSSSFRLSSFFGSANISSGAAMGGDVLQAIQKNVRPSALEQTLILLVANQQDEVMALRTILQRTKKRAIMDDITRRVVLVNCRLDSPVPRELVGAKTVYSILPWLDESCALTASPFQQQQQQQDAAEKPTKVVVMRRYPRDWQVFVDDGSTGTFELASTAPVRPTELRGPPMQWVSDFLKMFLATRMG